MIHPIIEAALEIAGTQDFDPEQIQRVEMTINPLAVKLTDIVDPRDRGQALVSFQHWTAVTLLYKAAGLAQVTNAVISEPRVSDLRRKVVYTASDDVGRDAARVRVVLNDGTTKEADVRQCRGSPDRPMSDEDITDKTLAQLQIGYTASAAQQILAQCWRIEEWQDASAFCKQLAEGLAA